MTETPLLDRTPALGYDASASELIYDACNAASAACSFTGRLADARR